MAANLDPRRVADEGLDDQLRRYETPWAADRRDLFAWDGDVTTSQRRESAIRAMLFPTTLESLEDLLDRADAKDMLRGIREVIVDEVHALRRHARAQRLLEAGWTNVASRPSARRTVNGWYRRCPRAGGGSLLAQVVGGSRWSRNAGGDEHCPE